LIITEHNVVQHLRRKNEKAITFIIHLYGGLISSIIKRHLNYQQQDYEECLDDVLLSVWNHIECFDPSRNSFKQWIAAIAKYKAIDYRRRQMIYNNKQQLVSEVNETSYSATGYVEDATSVEELFEQLSAIERSIFEQYYLVGTPTGEIAEQWNTKESWVYNKLSRGRKKLRNYLSSNHKK
jgi:RNA polymerase sigma factor (sigma-70 family)